MGVTLSGDEGLALTHFVLWVHRANDIHTWLSVTATAANHATFVATDFGGCTDFHDRRGGREESVELGAMMGVPSSEKR